MGQHLEFYAMGMIPVSTVLGCGPTIRPTMTRLYRLLAETRNTISHGVFFCSMPWKGILVLKSRLLCTTNGKTSVYIALASASFGT